MPPFWPYLMIKTNHPTTQSQPGKRSNNNCQQCIHPKRQAQWFCMGDCPSRHQIMDRCWTCSGCGGRHALGLRQSIWNVSRTPIHAALCQKLWTRTVYWLTAPMLLQQPWPNHDHNEYAVTNHGPLQWHHKWWLWCLPSNHHGSSELSSEPRVMQEIFEVNYPK